MRHICRSIHKHVIMRTYEKAFLFALTLFFFSGITALVYEIIWQRMLYLVFGQSMFAVTTIVATFMAGLGIGSMVFGSFSDRMQRPLRLYGILELTIAGFALLFPTILSGISHIYAGLLHTMDIPAFAVNAVKFFLCAPVLLIPTTCMGGTLPVIVRAVTARRAPPGRHLAGLYGVNTIGAVIGCSSAGFLLIAHFGTMTTTWLAAVVTICIGLIAIVMAPGLDVRDSTVRTTHDTDTDTTATPAHDTPVHTAEARNTTAAIAPPADIHRTIPGRTAIVLLVVTAVSGFCALSYEVIWTRVLRTFMEQSIYTFPAILTVFLAGLGTGGAIMSMWRHRHPDRSLLLLCALQAGIGLCAGATIWIFHAMTGFSAALWQGDTAGLAAFLFNTLAPAALVMGIPTILMGMSFPVAAAVYAHTAPSLGTRTGRIYAAMTFGNVAGTIIAGFVLLPVLGARTSIVVLAVCNILLSMAIMLVHPSFRAVTRAGFTAPGIAALLAVLFIHSRFDTPLILSSPAYGGVHMDNRILFHQHSPGGTVVVEETAPAFHHNRRSRKLQVNSITVAGSSPMLRITQKLQGHLPLLLFRAHTGRAPRNCFILGMGTGESSHAICTHDIDRLDCCELVSAEKDALPLFSHINHDVLHNPKFHPTFDDARSFLLRAPRTYDVIENDAIHPSINTTTYTKDYFSLCKRRLSPHGIFSSWIPLFDLSSHNIKVMIRTMQQVFPHVMIWYSPYHFNKHALLLGMQSPLRIHLPHLTEALAQPAVAADLGEFDLDDPYTILSCFITDERALTAYADAAPLNTDRTMYLPHRIPTQPQAGEETVRQLLRDMQRLRLPLSSYIATDTLPAAFDSLLHAHNTLHRLCMKGVTGFYTGSHPEALHALQQCRMHPLSTPTIDAMYRRTRIRMHVAMARRYASRGRLTRATSLLHDALEMLPDGVMLHNILGNVYLQGNRLDKALESFSTAIDIRPDFALPYHNIALVHHRQGDNAAARRYCDKALARNPYFTPAREFRAFLTHR